MRDGSHLRMAGRIEEESGEPRGRRASCFLYASIPVSSGTICLIGEWEGESVGCLPFSQQLARDIMLARSACRGVFGYDNCVSHWRSHSIRDRGISTIVDGIVQAHSVAAAISVTHCGQDDEVLRAAFRLSRESRRTRLGRRVLDGDSLLPPDTHLSTPSPF